MAALTTKRRNALHAMRFALPKQRAYPIDTCNRARNALARAAQQKQAGNLSPRLHAQVVKRANAKLDRDCR